MRRSDVRALLGSDFESFIKAPIIGDTIPTDAYATLGLHLYYDAIDELEFIETFRPCPIHYNHIRFFTDHNSGRLVLHRMIPSASQGISQLNPHLQELLTRLAEQGHVARYQDEGYYFDDVGFVLYVPNDSIEAVSIYRRGYYDA
jgi:hypothetical protein